MAQDITYWSVVRTLSDGTKIPLHAFGNQQEAQRYADSLPDSAGRHAAVGCQLRLYDTAIELDPTLDRASKISGLKKLTKEEKLALGLGHMNVV